MARMEIVEGRDAGSRFALNYSQHTTTELFRYAYERRLFENKLRFWFESDYWDFYQENMNETEGTRRREFKFDFVIEEQSRLIIPGLSSGISTFKTVEALRAALSKVRDSRIWLLEISTPIPEEFELINDRGHHVKIRPNKSVQVTVENFQEMLCCLNWVKFL
ncbi:uncharacterized protein LOC111339259 [Stylophora pistillata]|uniref:Uncharacterized protein n=1 Tax=Stylophora pistillata TaxID=50429 RepID=A0A2B4RJR0_STYPI|nr:uncharacterized protein LOC111339259 [Stylophora pistillata]PFX18634.1 hypothetical protein AWC38_SpisGene16981 [Stylophora pistillata]